MPIGRLAIALDNPDQRPGRRRKRRVADVFDRLRLGSRRPRNGRPPQQHAGRDRPRSRFARAGARHAADEHDGAVDGAAGWARRARARVVGVRAHPLRDRAGRRRCARSRAPAQGRRRVARVHPEGDVLDCEGGIPAATLDALEAAGEQIVRWPGLNIYFGGAQVVAHTAAGFAAAGDPRRGGTGIVVAARGGGERTPGLSKKPLRKPYAPIGASARPLYPPDASGSTPGLRSSASGLEGPADRVGDRRCALPEH